MITKSTIKEFINARNAYILAEAAYKTAKNNTDEAECKFMISRGYGNKYIWMVDVDSEILDALYQDFAKEYPDENAALIAAEDVASIARKKFAEVALSIVPLPVAEREILEKGIATNAAQRAKVIDLAMRLDVRTIPH